MDATTTKPPSAPAQGPTGEACTSCGSPLARDQRYCVACGARRGAPRVDFQEALGSGPPGGASPQAPASGRDPVPLLALGTLAALAIVLVVGVLIGKSTGSDSQGAPQVVTVGGAAPGAAANVSNTTFESDWPEGKSGYTIELGTLDKEGATAAQVKAAKDDATKQGAKEVGALDSDDYGSLPEGQYVVYSGVYDKAADAKKALAALKKDFPKAEVVKVSADGGGGAKAAAGGAAAVDKSKLTELDNATGEDYVKRSRKLPTTTVLPGKAPPKDNKAPGGGGGGEDIE